MNDPRFTIRRSIILLLIYTVYPLPAKRSTDLSHNFIALSISPPSLFSWATFVVDQYWPVVKSVSGKVATAIVGLVAIRIMVNIALLDNISCSKYRLRVIRKITCTPSPVLAAASLAPHAQFHFVQNQGACTRLWHVSLLQKESSVNRDLDDHPCCLPCSSSFFRKARENHKLHNLLLPYNLIADQYHIPFSSSTLTGISSIFEGPLTLRYKIMSSNRMVYINTYIYMHHCR